MARGGYRPGAGRKNKTESAAIKKLAVEIDEAAEKVEIGDLEAGEFLRSVWNDPRIKYDLRIRAAEVVLRTEGAKKGKKDEREEKAKNAGGGKFAAGAPPLRAVK